MFVNGFQANQPYQGMGASKSVARLVASLNTAAKRKAEATPLRSHLLTPRATIDDLQKDLETYRSLKYMQGLSRAVAEKRRGEAAEFQGLTEQRNLVRNALETERTILSNGGSTEPFQVPAWTGPLVTIQTTTRKSTVSAEQALQLQPDAGLQVSDAPIHTQVSASEPGLKVPTPVERSLAKIAALEQKLAEMEQRIDDFVSSANRSDRVERESGLSYLRVPLALKSSGDHGTDEDGSSPASEGDSSFFMHRTKENFLEKTQSAAELLETQADDYGDAINRLYDKYKQKYNISLEELCDGLPSLAQTAEQNERLLALLQKRPNQADCWA